MNSRRYVICDLEATGLHEEKDIIEIALITYQDGKVVEVWDSLVNPLMPVPEFVHQLTGISLRDLDAAPKFYDLAEAIRLRLEGATFVSHNTDFDLSLLRRKFAELGQELRVRDFCTLKVAQQEIPGLKNYNLDALCSFFGIKIKERHRAIGDARATLELFQELAQLRMPVRQKVIFLPHHERDLKRLPAKAGLLRFRDADGKVVRLEPAFNLLARARELLEVRPENRELLLATEALEGEVTGSALIAEFRCTLARPTRYQWTVVVEESAEKEKHFKLRRLGKGGEGTWFFTGLSEAKRKLTWLRRRVKGESFAYRDGGKSKEEIFRHNQQVESLVRDENFPAENLVIVGEGRVLGERSLVLVRNGHVVGHGYTEAPEAEIYADPEAHLLKRFSRNLALDLAAKRYLKVLKNLRGKKEGWRSLSDHGKISPSLERNHESHTL